ncbi:adenylate/guanylate cyclase domain-containing protein [Roseimaritima ulvae]|nr:adenylate/guanylate cyclase domain-containing protein [Roseimaritima ulvae]
MDRSMPDLIAQGPRMSDRWRRALPVANEADQPAPSVCLGRAEGTWQIDWDDRISRRHALVTLQSDGKVLIERLESGRNPIFHSGQRRDRFTLGAGEHFVIGRTTFTLAQRPVVNADSAEPLGVTEHAFDRAALRRQGFRDAARRIDVLSRLPDLIAGSSTDTELLVRVAGVLLQATPDASAVAILQVLDQDADPDDGGAVDVLHYDSRSADSQGPNPSARLARRAVRSGESVLHLWGSGSRRGSGGGTAYTASEDVDWAFCVPIRSDACRGWALYITGQLGIHGGASLEQSLQAAPTDLQDDVKFTELVATTLGNLRQVRSLQRRQAGLRRFFAPVVMEALATRDADEVLEPREADVSVLFCDLRGFSRRSEEASDQLLDLLTRVSEALGVMTRHILDRDGVVGDFHGDAAMGFWGWPLDQDDAPGRACRAAIAINEEFLTAATGANRPMSGFRCGIGIATGRAVAGRIGTIDQVKVTAFGPVVNLASRLEGMTRPLSAEILIDEATADFVRHSLPPSVARVRRLLRVRPAGFQAAIDVCQLLPPAGPQSPLADADLLRYEAALDALILGRWDEAFAALHEVPAADRAKDFLTATIARHGRVPPPGWDGVIDLPKG